MLYNPSSSQQVGSIRAFWPTALLFKTWPACVANMQQKTYLHVFAGYSTVFPVLCRIHLLQRRSEAEGLPSQRGRAIGRRRWWHNLYTAETSVHNQHLTQVHKAAKKDVLLPRPARRLLLTTRTWSLLHPIRLTGGIQAFGQAEVTVVVLEASQRSQSGSITHHHLAVISTSSFGRIRLGVVVGCGTTSPGFSRWSCVW